jgi:hypothetical protein
METIAVYSEPKIKTYGFYEYFDLSLLELGFKAERLGQWGSVIQKLGDLDVSFNLVLTQYLGTQGLRTILLYKCQWETKILGYIDPVIQEDAGEQIHVTSPVELIYFYGPHFGDRYGIADSVFRTLSAKSFPILAAGFSGSAVYLVVPKGKAQGARIFLSDAFEVPQTTGPTGDSH